MALVEILVRVSISHDSKLSVEIVDRVSISWRESCKLSPHSVGLFPISFLVFRFSLRHFPTLVVGPRMKV